MRDDGRQDNADNPDRFSPVVGGTVSDPPNDPEINGKDQESGKYTYFHGSLPHNNSCWIDRMKDIVNSSENPCLR
jgi:hypothetical protein